MIRFLLTFFALATLGFAASGDVSVVIREDGYSADVYVEGFTTGATVTTGHAGTYKEVSGTTPFFTVTSKGFNSTGAATTTTRTVYLGTPMRKPYPNQASRDEDTSTVPGSLRIRFSLSEPIYAKDDTGAGNSGTAPTFTAPAGFIRDTLGDNQNSGVRLASSVVTNNSTLAYPKVIGQWDWRTTKPYMRKTANFDVGFRAVHAFGIAGVRFDATGVTSGDSETATVTALSKIGPCASGLYYDSYKTTFSIAAFTQGEQVRLRARVYPRVGDTSEDLDTEDITTIEQAGNGRIEVTCDKTGALASYAVVKTAATGGNDSTGATSATLGTADGTPYATIAEAINDNANVICLTDDGTATHAFGITPIKSQLYALEIRPHPNDVAENITMTLAVGSGSVRCTHLALVGGYNVSILAGSYFFDGVSSTYDSTFLADGVTWTSASTSLFANVNDFKLINWVDVTTTAWQMERSGTTAFAWSAMGCVLNSPAAVGIDSFGCFVANSQGTSNYRITVTTGSLTNPAHIDRNIMFDYNRLDRYTINSSGNGFDYDEIILGDFSMRGNLIVNSGTNEGDNFFWTVDVVDNIIFAANTVQGMPLSFVYNSGGASALSTNFFCAQNATYRISTKTDTFNPPDGSRVGNWAFVFGVGVRNNRVDGSVGFLPGDSGGQSPGGWNGINSGMVGGSAAYTDLGYTLDNSRVGAGGGGGNYLPTEGSVLRNAMPASESYIAFDLFGTNIPESGTMDIGAVLNASAVTPPPAPGSGVITTPLLRATNFIVQ